MSILFEIFASIVAVLINLTLAAALILFIFHFPLAAILIALYLIVVG